MAHKAVFLDRDDTIIDDPGYIRNPEQIRLIPGATEAMVQLKRMGYLLVIITNQSGVARGFVTEKQLEEIHQELKRRLIAEGVEVDGLYYCPYHPDGVVADFSMESNLRKPNAGMLFEAEKDLDINLTQSWMIGDSYRDVQAGKAAGCHTILVDVPGKIREKKSTDSEPDRKAVNLREAVNIIRMYEFHQKTRSAKGRSRNTDAQRPESSSEAEQADGGLSDSIATAQPAAPLQLQTEKHAAESSPVTPVAQPGADTETVTEEPPKEEQSPAKKTTPTKVYTTRNLRQDEKPAPSDTDSETRHLLAELVRQLRSKNREGLYQEFSVFKLLSMMVQVIAVVALIASLFFWLSRGGSSERVLIMIGYSIALQLIVIALLLMHSKD